MLLIISNNNSIPVEWPSLKFLVDRKLAVIITSIEQVHPYIENTSLGVPYIVLPKALETMHGTDIIDMLKFAGANRIIDLHELHAYIEGVTKEQTISKNLVLNKERPLIFLQHEQILKAIDSCFLSPQLESCQHMIDNFAQTFQKNFAVGIFLVDLNTVLFTKRKILIELLETTYIHDNEASNGEGAGRHDGNGSIHEVEH